MPGHTPRMEIVHDINRVRSLLRRVTISRNDNRPQLHIPRNRI